MGGSDTFDQMISNYSCRRATGRWTMRLFHYIIDSLLLNTFVITNEIFPTNEMRRRYGLKKSQRRIFLEKIAISLMKPQIVIRSASYRSLQGVSSRLQDSFKFCGFPVTRNPENQQKSSKLRGRCYSCPRSVDRKVSTTCHRVSDCYYGQTLKMYMYSCMLWHILLF